jgi:hypothetical protein
MGMPLVDGPNPVHGVSEPWPLVGETDDLEATWLVILSGPSGGSACTREPPDPFPSSIGME